MNTRDTDEGRARPSVWPVYVISAMIGLFSLVFLSWVWFVPWMARGYAALSAEQYQFSPSAHQFAHMMKRLAPYALLFGVYGLFGIVTAVGVALFRSWSWWCAVVWGAGLFVWRFFMRMNLPAHRWDVSGILFTLAFFALIVWPLATRRRLFFPPKAEREE